MTVVLFTCAGQRVDMITAFGRAGATTLAVDVNELAPVLVDPGFLGLVPSCPAPNPDGNRPCTRDPSIGPCAPVVYVRVGADAYAAYPLAGGP